MKILVSIMCEPDIYDESASEKHLALVNTISDDILVVDFSNELSTKMFDNAGRPSFEPRNELYQLADHIILPHSTGHIELYQRKYTKFKTFSCLYAKQNGYDYVYLMRFADRFTDGTLFALSAALEQTPDAVFTYTQMIRCDRQGVAYDPIQVNYVPGEMLDIETIGVDYGHMIAVQRLGDFDVDTSMSDLDQLNQILADSGYGFGISHYDGNRLYYFFVPTSQLHQNWMHNKGSKPTERGISAMVKASARAKM